MHHTFPTDLNSNESIRVSSIVGYKSHHVIVSNGNGDKRWHTLMNSMNINLRCLMERFPLSSWKKDSWETTKNGNFLKTLFFFFFNQKSHLTPFWAGVCCTKSPCVCDCPKGLDSTAHVMQTISAEGCEHCLIIQQRSSKCASSNLLQFLKKTTTPMVQYSWLFIQAGETGNIRQQPEKPTKRHVQEWFTTAGKNSKSERQYQNYFLRRTQALQFWMAVLCYCM